MTEHEFQKRMSLAQTFRSLGHSSDYYAGYMRGLRRHYHGEKFGTENEHAMWLALDEDETRADIGRGYRDGFDGKIPEIKESPGAI